MTFIIVSQCFSGGTFNPFNPFNVWSTEGLIRWVIKGGFRKPFGKRLTRATWFMDQRVVLKGFRPSIIKCLQIFGYYLNVQDGFLIVISALFTTNELFLSFSHKLYIVKWRIITDGSIYESSWLFDYTHWNTLKVNSIKWN